MSSLSRVLVCRLNGTQFESPRCITRGPERRSNVLRIRHRSSWSTPNDSKLFTTRERSAVLKLSRYDQGFIYEIADEDNTDLEDTETEAEEGETEKSGSSDFGFLNLSDSEDEEPWEGAIVYKRDHTTDHVEYCTTLERLGLKDVSTELSKSTASDMGLRVTKGVRDYPSGTPVQVSVDVSRRKHNMRLDGVLKTVIAIPCMRCGDPAAKSIIKNFAFLLQPEIIEVPSGHRRTVVQGSGENMVFIVNGVVRREGEDESIEHDDRFYFPPHENQADLSKNIMDMIHVEIALDALCHPKCRGLCDRCFGNLNWYSCVCGLPAPKTP